MDWDSKQYLKFKAQRTQPAIDLANRIRLDNPERILDIGCGPGNSTKVLADRFPNAYILGVDNSDEMITAAKKNYPDLEFEKCDAGTELSQFDKSFDVVFSNACIQWVPDHRNLILSMLNVLRNSNGVLAIQVPMNFNEPIHLIIDELAASRKWKDYFRFSQIYYTLSPGEYFDILSELSGDFDIWETIYYHVMKSHQDILEWYKGTGLRPYLDVLPDDKKAEFEKDFLDKLVQRYPRQKNGEIIFRFPRFFFTANPKS